MLLQQDPNAVPKNNAFHKRAFEDADRLRLSVPPLPRHSRIAHFYRLPASKASSWLAHSYEPQRNRRANRSGARPSVGLSPDLGTMVKGRIAIRLYKTKEWRDLLVRSVAKRWIIPCIPAGVTSTPLRLPGCKTLNNPLHSCGHHKRASPTQARYLLASLLLDRSA